MGVGAQPREQSRGFRENSCCSPQLGGGHPHAVLLKSSNARAGFPFAAAGQLLLDFLLSNHCKMRLYKYGRASRGRKFQKGKNCKPKTEFAHRVCNSETHCEWLSCCPFRYSWSTFSAHHCKSVHLAITETHSTQARHV